MNKFSFTGSLKTDSFGAQTLNDFFTYASQFNNCWFTIDVENLKFIDANLCAELCLYCHLLKKKNNLKFYIDYYSLKGDLNILDRNGFAYYVVNDKSKFHPYDDRDTAIPLRAFKTENADGFADYVENKFLKQRGMANVSMLLKDRIMSSYCEIFDNVGIHANTESAVLCCGQFYPHLQELKFTLTDYGDGFLKKIKEFTKGNENIIEASKAISWAVKGGSTKENNIKGGNGLKKIFMYCFKYNGILTIVSDGCFWELQNKTITTKILNNFRKGTTIHLTFRF